MFQKLTKFPIYSMINLTSRVYWPFEGMRSKLMMSSKRTDHLFHMVLVIDACFLIYNLSWNSKKRQQNQTLYYYIYIYQEILRQWPSWWASSISGPTMALWHLCPLSWWKAHLTLVDGGYMAGTGGDSYLCYMCYIYKCIRCTYIYISYDI